MTHLTLHTAKYTSIVLYAINVYVIIIAYYKARHVLKDGVVGFRSYCSARQIIYCVVS